ncbi:hypothetical protein EGM51_09920 [Verrucomicrobia bacterium S94]|nr:hypothetical protein EGM51_09920 [Verrucomicrobia bacterium S94]
MSLTKNGISISPDQSVRDIEIYAYKNNINFITKWHNFTVTTYGAYLENLDPSLTEEDRTKVKSVAEGFMERKTRNFCFIMHMSNFEEISYLICKSENVEIENNSSIKRFAEGWKKRTGKDLSTLKEWTILTNAEKVRHCILHACERLSLVKEKKRPALESIINQENLPVNSGRVEITIDYLNKVKNSIIRILEI